MSAQTLLTVAQVAKMLQLSESYIQKSAKSGKLIGHRFGSAWRFAESDVQSFINANRHVPLEPPKRGRRRQQGNLSMVEMLLKGQSV